jgi:predicted DNA-binding protein
MAVLKRKSRMISLRLSDEEYESLRSLYGLHGSRSVSEFARNAMQKAIGETVDPHGNTLENRMFHLDTKMTSLDHEVARLVSLIESRLDPATRTVGSRIVVDAA